MRPAISSETLATLSFALASTPCRRETPARGSAQRAGRNDKAVRGPEAANDSKDDAKKNLES
jgi:hypothetical protein